MAFSMESWVVRKKRTMMKRRNKNKTLLAFSMESWVVKKKRTMMKRRKKSKTLSLFDNLPEEVQSEIFKRLSGKSISKSMCVSHTWRDIILNNTPLQNSQQAYLVTSRLFPDPFLDLGKLFLWCSRVMCYGGISLKYLNDTCNGLLLFCHKNGEAGNLTHGVYHYYVMNRVTKQCLAILKPTGIISRGYSYASLAYDPAKSRFFKIMRFQGCRHVNVFSSKNGRWKTLTLNLPSEVNEAHWVRKSVYTKGAIYRLSWSGHLIKFMVNRQKTIEEQAVALPLPPACLLNSCHWDIGVRHGGNLLFVMSLGAYLFIFEHMECVESGGISYEWRKICRINDWNLRDLNSYGELLSYHPYQEVAFFKRWSLLFFYFIDANDDPGPHVIPYDKMLYDYIQNCGLPLLDFSTTFSCTLDKKHPRVFQWLRVPENRRQRRLFGMG